MKVTQNKIDDLNLTLSINIEKVDYEEQKRKKLNDYRRKAEIKGFRRGMAPMSLIEKIHGGQALAEIINTTVNEQIEKFIKDNNLNIIGEPLPSEKADTNDWNNPDEFNFDFDIALSPDVNVTVTSEDIIPYYLVTLTDEAKADYRHSLLKQFGSLATGEAAGAEDFVIADFEAEEQKIEGAYVALRSIKDEEAKASFIGKKAGDAMDVDIVKTFANESDRAAMFKVKKEELGTLPTMWKMTVNEVKTFVDAELTQGTFDQIFGEGVVTSEAEFDVKVAERLAAEYAQESNYRFMLDAKEYFLNKAAIQLPDAFMKRWLFTANEGKFTMEQIEKEYDLFAKDYRWEMIRTKIMKEQDMKVSKEAMMEEAKKMAAYQFSMYYGMNDVPDDVLEGYAQKSFGDEQQVRRLIEKVSDDMVITYIRNTASMDTKDVTLEEMRKLTA